MANLACLARGKSESGEGIFSRKRRKDTKVRSDVGMGLITKLCVLGERKS